MLRTRLPRNSWIFFESIAQEMFSEYLQFIFKQYFLIKTITYSGNFNLLH